MSRINDLIRQFCPHGVEFKPLSDVTTRASNVRWAGTGEAIYRYIDLTSVDRVTRKIGDTATIAAGNAPGRAQQIVHAGDVIFATTRPTQMRWAVIPPEYDGQIASTGYCVLRPIQNQLLTSFIAHLLGAERFYRYIEEKQVPGNYPSIPDSQIRAFKVPVPPLEVQREIARVLELFRSLDAELDAELEARRLQYTFYRDRLLTQPETNGARRIPLGEVATVGVGQAPREGTLYDTGSYDFVNAGTSASGRISEANTPGDTVTIPSRGQGGVGIVGYQGEDFWCGPLCYRIRSMVRDLNTRFLYYYLKSIQPVIRGLQQTGGTPALNRKELVLVGVPVPHLSEQERIVRILDKFDALMNDVQAELDARRQQYAYYRDELLTFDEAVA